MPDRAPNRSPTRPGPERAERRGAVRSSADKAERRSDLLRAARTVFATRGYHDARIDEIAAQAGVAKGTFYLYFKDKRSIFVELLDALFERISRAILRVVVSSTNPVKVRRTRSQRAISISVDISSCS